MTRQEIENILPFFCNMHEEKCRCELVLLTSQDTYRHTNIASIIKYEYEKYIVDINDAMKNNEDLRKGIVSMRQLEHSFKIKHSIIAESIEWVYGSKNDEHLHHLFARFLGNVSSLATTYAEMLKRKQEGGE